MTDKRPSDLILDWGLMPKPHGWSQLDEKQPQPERKESESEQQREATRLELTNRPPESAPQNETTIQAPGMGGAFVNNRAVETEAQRQARLAKDLSREMVEPEKPEPPSPEKAPERVQQIEKDRPSRGFLERELLPPWERDPRR